MNDFVVVPGPRGDDSFVELARSQRGRLFKKEILKMDSSFVHPSAPGKIIHIDHQFAEALKRNFKAGICDIVQVPMVNDANQHVEDPSRNVGEVVDLSYDDKGIYAVIDARKHAEDFGTTLLGASAMLSTNYTDHKTGAKVGPTLLHVAVTNRPYITNLDDYEEIVAASADTSGETPVVLIPATKTEETMDLDLMLSTLKDEHGIDVLALQAQAENSNEELLTALSNVIAPESDDTLTIKDVADAVIELAEERVALSGQVETLVKTNEAMALKEAESEVDRLISEGRILPKSREVMVALSREDRAKFDALVPDTAIVSLSATGVETHDAPAESQQMIENIERLATLANKN